MKVGFFGTRYGTTSVQFNVLQELISKLDMTEFHHTDYVGADAQAHDLVRSVFPKVRIYTHPQNSFSYRAFCRGDVIRQGSPFLVRNRVLIKSVDTIVIVPSTMQADWRSSVWIAARKANALHRLVIMVLPDGTIQNIERTEAVPILLES